MSRLEEIKGWHKSMEPGIPDWYDLAGELLTMLDELQEELRVANANADLNRAMELNYKEQLDKVRTGCEWTADDMDNSYWESSCGGSWEFNDGGVQDNGLKYCPFCSGKIIEALNGKAKS